ncbi:MAG: hypothetical protein QXK76_04315 [Candidatus Woesearchaeota archaeon]
MIKILSVGIITGLLNLNSYSLAQTNKKIITTETLTVNTSNLERIIAFIDEKQGIEQLQKLIKNSEYEESWVFDKTNNIWIEIGYEESGWRTDSLGTYNKVSLDTSYISKIINSGNEIIFYHIHPIKNYPKPKNDEKINSLIKKYGIEIIAYQVSAFPSTNDIQTMIKLQEAYYKKNPEGNIKHKIVSYLGVTEYNLTKKAIKSLDKNINILYYDSILMNMMLYSKIVSINKKEDNLEEEIEETSINNIIEVLSKRNNEYIEIKFTPLRSIQIIEK